MLSSTRLLSDIVNFEAPVQLCHVNVVTSLTTLFRTPYYAEHVSVQVKA